MFQGVFFAGDFCTSSFCFWSLFQWGYLSESNWSYFKAHLSWSSSALGIFLLAIVAQWSRCRTPISETRVRFPWRLRPFIIEVYGFRDSENFEGAQGPKSQKSQILFMKSVFSGEFCWRSMCHGADIRGYNSCGHRLSNDPEEFFLNKKFSASNIL